jgi:hypothetical protein
MDDAVGGCGGVFDATALQIGQFGQFGQFGRICRIGQISEAGSLYQVIRSTELG